MKVPDILMKTMGNFEQPTIAHKVSGKTDNAVITAQISQSAQNQFSHLDTLQDKMIHLNQCSQNSQLPKNRKKLNPLVVNFNRCYLPENDTEVV